MGRRAGVNFMKRDNVILIGFMGTGKSTVGRLLAEALGWAYLDSDSCIVEEQGLTIPEIFERDGEERFRAMESDVLRRVMNKPQQVIATGGGAVLAEVNRIAMLESGYVVALKADKGEIIARVSKETGRPLLKGDLEKRVELLLESRETAYDFADLIVDTTGISPEKVVDLIQTARQEAFR
jgi:shikimate kinase